MKAAQLLLLCSLSGGAFAAQAAPWQEMFTGRGKPVHWDDPEGRFRLDLPRGWKGPPIDDEDAPPIGASVQFYRSEGAPAVLLVDMRNLPEGAALPHFSAQIEAEAKRAAPGYKQLSLKHKRVSGLRAIRRRFVYRDRNNAQLMKDVTQYVLLHEHRGYVLSFVCALGQRPALKKELELLIEGFSLGGAAPQTGPGGRIRLKAGEVVNPKGLRY